MSHHEKKAATATPVTHESVQAWLDAYARAWETYDAADIAPLFSENAEYRWHPADEPEVGRDRIVEEKSATSGAGDWGMNGNSTPPIVSFGV